MEEEIITNQTVGSNVREHEKTLKLLDEKYNDIKEENDVKNFPPL